MVCVRRPTEDDCQLLDLAMKCSTTCQELQQEVQKIRNTIDGETTNTVTKLYRSMRLASPIEKLRTRLTEYQHLLETRLLISLFTKAQSIDLDQRQLLEKHDENLRYFVSRLANGFTKMEALIKAESTTIRDYVSSEHEAVGTHVNGREIHLYIE